MKIICLFVLFFLELIPHGFAQSNVENIPTKDTSFTQTTPILLNMSALITTRVKGFRVGFEQLLSQKEVQKLRQSGKVKTLKIDRLLALDLGYYYQSGLHHNWFLTAAYKLKRTGTHGFYTEFSPLIGLSRTFLTEETYTVDANGVATVKTLAGNWYVASGFNLGLGQNFSEQKNFILKDLHASLFFQILYPNFGSIAIKPFMQIGTSVRLEKIQRLSKKIIRYKS
jgi:hypothetical protein